LERNIELNIKFWNEIQIKRNKMTPSK